VIDDDEKRETIKTGVLFVFGVFCLAMCYNLFLQPNNLVIGGASGLSLILNKITGLSSDTYVYLINIIALFVSYFVLGVKETKNCLIGSLLFPLMITFTTPISDFILPYLTINEFIVTTLLTGLLYGFSNGLIYKCGYNVGGGDVLIRIITVKKHVSQGTSSFIMNVVIISLGAIYFGIVNAIYSIFILYVSSLIIDKVMFGISDSKVFYIYTKKSNLIKRLLLKEFKAGFTILPTKGGYSHINGNLIMCVLPNREYFELKKRILDIDPKAFFIITECYESKGGFRQKNLPFL
jgi:uncharacterized membrane-anchored protein YitT (DUF2179 family)